MIPGFSGMVDAGDGTFWALPDNGFGTKANSADFLLPHLPRDARTGRRPAAGPVRSTSGSSSPCATRTTGSTSRSSTTTTPDRLLTGADFDVESVVRAKDGRFWIGEEFGPFLLHVDAHRQAAAAPVPFPAGSRRRTRTCSRARPPGTCASRGFEAMAGSRDGRFLYPIIEGAFVDDADQRRRAIYEFDTATGAYTGTRWAYQTHQDANVIGDALHRASKGKLLVIERDDFQGAAVGDQARVRGRPRPRRRRRASCARRWCSTC